MILDRWSYAGMAVSLFSLGFIASTAIAVAQDSTEDTVGASQGEDTCKCPEPSVCPPEGYMLVPSEAIRLEDALREIQQAQEAMKGAPTTGAAE